MWDRFNVDSEVIDIKKKQEKPSPLDEVDAEWGGGTWKIHEIKKKPEMVKGY